MSLIWPQEILKFHNEARTNPHKFVEHVQNDINQFDKSGTTLPLK